MRTPLDFACIHAPSPAEASRDPDYRGCNADPGAPCTWAHRWDGVADPPFHSERLEAAAYVEPHTGQVTDEAFEQAVLASGLV